MRHNIRPKSKYGAKKTQVNGINFDSQAEARYYQKLLLAIKSGDLLMVLLQVPFRLPGKTKYVVDFQEFWADGTIRFVDVKGMETQIFKLKKRQVEELYPIIIEIEK